MPSTGFIAWLSAHEQQIGGVVGSALTIGAIAWSRLASTRTPKAWKVEDAKGPVAPMPVALPPVLPQTSSDAELQAMKARYMSTEAILLETQQAIARIRQAMDAQVRDAAREEGALSAALVSERAENERLRAEVAQLKQAGADLIAEMARLRSGSSLPPPARKLRSVPPGRGRER